MFYNPVLYKNPVRFTLPQPHKQLKSLTIMCMLDILSLQNPAQNKQWFLEGLPKAVSAERIN